MKVISVIVASLILSAASLYAQGGSAAITGTVTDPSGAVVPGVPVTVTQQNTDVKRSLVTNQDGQFTVPSLLPSTYTVTVEAPRFKSYTETLTLLADEIRSVRIQLQLGSTVQSVNVEGAAVMVNTVTPVLSQVIEQARVIDLPLNGRNAADLTLLVPGAVTANGHGSQQGTSKQIPGTEAIAVNGTRTDQISYNLDGGNNQDLMSNTNDPFPFPDALQEFSVQTNSFDAQYGSNAGAVVNVVTKSGTNEWHGDGFEFVRNKIFNARNFFSPTVDPLKRNQFGGTIGGPIRKNSTFIFFGYQGTRIRSQSGGQNAFVPTPANLQGDFSAYESASNPANPTGKVVQILNPVTGQPYSGDIIPPNQLNQVALNFSKFLPISSAAPNGAVVFANLLHQDLNEYVARLDQVVRGQDRLSFRFYLNRFNNLPGYDGHDLLTVNSNAGTGSIVQSQNYLINYTWVPTAHFVNDLVLDVVRTASDRTQGGNVPQLNDMGAQLFQLPKAQGGLRGFGVTGFFGIGNFTDGIFVRNAGNIRDTSTYVWGKHTLTFGGEVELDQANVRNTDFENGNFTFNSNVTNLAMASFLLGKLYSFTQTSGNYSDQRQTVLGLFVTDKWHVAPRLTVDLGLRWEPQSPMKEIYGRVQQFVPGAAAAGVRSNIFPNAPPGLFFVGDSYNGYTVPATGETPDNDNFAPRGGFAYDVFGNGKTVIRGGGGVFYYTRLPGLFGNDASIVPPFSLSLSLNPPAGSLTNPLQGQQQFEAGFPQRFTLQTAPRNVIFPAPVRVYGLESNRQWVTPVIYDWNFTIEHQLRSDTLLRTSYVGTHGSHLREDVDLNPAVYIPGSTLGTDARRVYPGFSDILVNMNNANSNYNALQVDLEKRPSGNSTGILRNMTLLASYTYSKAMDNLPANGGGITDVGSSNGSGVPIYNLMQGAFNTGPSDFNHTQRFVASYVWALPRLLGASRLVRATLGGWNWTGIYSITSGDVLTLLAGRDQSKTGLNGDRAQFIGTASQYGGPTYGQGGCRPSETCVPWINPSLFALPAVGTFGNVGKDAFVGPTLWNVDMGLIKDFYPLAKHENIYAEIRGEFFNIFNHPTFQDPDVTVADAGFGGIRAANDPRIIQLAVKLFF